ncbi:hypothetical protein AAG570_003212 [Ranatra chinensis]|uniref:Cytosol aminopeptidase domain-containing protein n=1 Tax=Ranatra chinensis TaxID=642074 RepID=A0ABD0Y6Q9_9HEMI
MNRTPESSLCLYDDPDMAGWERGAFKAEAQNIARKLEDTPPNAMTPAIFSQEAMEILCPCEVQVVAHDRDWLEDKCMNAFITLARSSCDPPIMLELSYCGGAEDDKPVVIVGKGTTFDCGGLCLQRGGDMSECRADMAGAAVIVATLKALAMLKVPINVNALIPLYENMPGGMAIKPGDVVTGLCGKNIRVTDTSKEARVILTDPLTFSSNYKPCLVINVATLTAGVRTALGTSSTGVFTTSDVVWNELSRAGAETGDRVWRLPLWKHFTSNIKSYDSVDVDNVGNGRGGDPCVGAAFLREFAPPIDFLHLDITGTGMLASDPSHPYLREGYMTGRPTRTLVQFLYQMACPMDKSDDGR